MKIFAVKASDKPEGCVSAGGKGKSKPFMLILLIVLMGSSLFYMAMVTPESFGLYHDDGIYVVMAKAMATGQGYRIISLPDEPLQAKSPPLHLFLLSLIWKAYPHFPENLSLMMFLSVLATVVSLILVWLYLVRQGYSSEWQALIVVSLVALNWRTAILASGVYSEMIYMVLSITGLYLAEDYYKNKKTWIKGAALGLIMGFAFLTRTSGITLLMAVALYYILRRQFFRSLLPLCVASSLVIAWLGWGYFNAGSVQSVNAGYYESYFHTFSEVFKGSQDGAGGSKLIPFLSMLGKNSFMIIFVSVPLICLGLDFDWPHNLTGYAFNVGLALFVLTFLLIVAGFRRHISAGLRLLHVYILMYLGLHILWPYTAYDRFLMPLLPFLLLFLVKEMDLLVSQVRKEFTVEKRLVKRASAAFVGLALLVLICALFYIYYLGIDGLSGYSREMARRNAEDVQAIEWIKAQTDPSDVLVCYRDPTYYLYTGRKAARPSPMREGGLVNERQASFDEQAEVIFRIISENKARYLILTWTDLELQDQADPYQQGYKMILAKHPDIFVPVFQSEDMHTTIYRITYD